MKVVHLAYDYGTAGVGGAAIAATRLHCALLSHGVESHYICCHQAEPGTNVMVLPLGRLARAVRYLVTRAIWCLGYITGQHRIFTPNLVPLWGLERCLRRLAPDVIHVHWIMMDMISFGQLAHWRTPTVMTLHDLFMVNVLEPYPAADRRYLEGVNRGNAGLVERWLFARKRRAMSACRPLIVGPSEWICRLSSQSVIGRGLEAVMLPNLVDPAFFAASASPGANPRMRVVFGAVGGRTNPVKGWDDLAAALKRLPAAVRERMEVSVFGESAADCELAHVPVRFAGVVKSVAAMRQIYAAGDVFALPSREDNAPQTKFEALLSGLMVVAFDRTGCAEGIENGVNGFVAADGDLDGYARALEAAFRLWERGELGSRRPAIAAAARARYGEDALVDGYLKLYASASERSSRCKDQRKRCRK